MARKVAAEMERKRTAASAKQLENDAKTTVYVDDDAEDSDEDVTTTGGDKSTVADELLGDELLRARSSQVVRARSDIRSFLGPPLPPPDSLDVGRAGRQVGVSTLR
jgi:hypothetical protein